MASWQEETGEIRILKECIHWHASKYVSEWMINVGLVARMDK